MSSGGWTTAHGTEVAGGGDYRQPPGYVLRPLSLGEILDRSFAVYRANFWLFVGIAVLSAVVQLAVNGVLMVIYRGFIPAPHTKAPFVSATWFPAERLEAWSGRCRFSSQPR